MNKKVITLMLCMGLITIGAPSAMGMKLNSNMKLVKPLVKIGMLSNTEDNLGILTGGLLYEDSYEIEILDGGFLQVKKLERCLKNDYKCFFSFVHLKNIDLKITYKKAIVDPDNSTESYGTFLYEKDGLEIIDGLEILNEPHTVIIKGFTGWLLKLGIGSWDTEENNLDDFFFVGGYESLEILGTS